MASYASGEVVISSGMPQACNRLPATRPVPAYETKIEGGDVYVRGPAAAKS